MVPLSSLSIGKAVTSTLKSQQKRLSDVHSKRQQRKGSAKTHKVAKRTLERRVGVGLVPPGPVDSVALFSTIHLNLKTFEYGVETETFLGKE